MFGKKQPVSPSPEATFLITVTNNITIGLIECILEEHHIPFLNKAVEAETTYKLSAAILLSGLIFVRHEHCN